MASVNANPKFNVGDKVVRVSTGKMGVIRRQALAVSPAARDRWYVYWSDDGSETHIHQNELRLVERHPNHG